MSESEIGKRIAVKFVGSNRATENLVIAPGTTTREVLRELKLDGAGFQLSDGRGDTVFNSDDVLYALVADGDLLYASAAVVAGASLQWAA